MIRSSPSLRAKCAHASSVHTVLALALALASGPAAAAQVSGYFRHNAPGIFVNTESRQTAATGPLSDSNQPLGGIIYGSYIVDYGSIMLSSRHLGLQDGSLAFSNAGTTAGFEDTLTITSATAAPFSMGTFVARIDVSGNLQATGNGQSHYIVNVDTALFRRQITGSLYGPLASGNPGVIIGDDFGSHFMEIPFVFGQPFALSVMGNVDATVRLNAAGSAWTNLSSTIGWAGITEVRNNLGAVLPDFSVASQSGYDYATVVPLPAGAWLFATGLVALVARLRRRARTG